MLHARAAGLLLALGALLASLGCFGDKHQITINDRFSMNVVRTPLWFPDVKKQPLTPAEKEVIARRGPPPYIHFWWRSDGALITTADLSGLENREIEQRMMESTRSWLYPSDSTEIVFLPGGTGYRQTPLGDQLKLICSWGDPSSRSPQVMEAGHRVEDWQWIEQGVQIRFSDGTEISRSYFPATGAGTFILK